MLVVEIAAICGALLFAAIVLSSLDRDDRTPIEWSEPTPAEQFFAAEAKQAVTDEAIYAWLRGPYDQERDAA